MSLRPQLALLTTVLAVVSLAAQACTASSTPTASGDTKGTSLVLAVPNEPATLNPLAGYAGNGAAKIFDGLVEHEADSGLRPALAVELPKPSEDGRSWTVRLRPGVHFTDGTAFDADDVAATYRALLDPSYGSPLRDRYRMITGVVAVDAMTVRFDLAHPYAPLPHLLVLGVLPSEALTAPAPVTRPDFKAVGTGPYELVEWRRDALVLRANRTYFGGPPTVTTVTVTFVKDDEVRAQQTREGKFDGVALPPTHAASFDGIDPFTVVTQRSADVRAVLLPAGNPVTADPAMRLALNRAVDRGALVAGPLAGKGSQAHTPVPPVLAETVEPSARFEHVPAQARQSLDEAGWTEGADGVRVKAGVPAKFTLWYPAGDSVARGLADAFAADVRKIGVLVSTQPEERSAVAGHAGSDATLIATGDPFDPDLSLYPLLRTSSAEVDATLDAGRTAVDPAQRTAQYRKLQRAYVGAPGMVALAAVDHTYVMRENWTGYRPVVDGHQQDATWGPWWNLHRWAPR